MHRIFCQLQSPRWVSPHCTLGLHSAKAGVLESPLRVPTETAFPHLTFPKAIPFLSFPSSYGRGWQKLTPSSP